MALSWGHPLPLVCTALALALGLAAAWRGLRAWRGSPARRLKCVGRVSGLFLYPVKSCHGLSVDRAEVTELGLRSGLLSDRYWTVMKEDGEMLSAKQEPRLVLISVTCEDGYITLNAPEMKALKIPLELPRTNSVRNCRRLGAEGQGRDCGEEAAQWITTFLNTWPYRLAHYEPNMMTQASLDDLNSRLDEKVAIKNFRPNIFVTGCAPYEEDSWSEILIGNVQMKGRVPCPRCIFTTIDPSTGIMHKKEPLKTMKSYRKYASPEQQRSYKSYPPFGCLYGIEKTGMLAVGDPVYEII